MAGYPLSNPEQVPSLVQKNGSFLTSRMHRQLDQEHPHHLTYEDALTETENGMYDFSMQTQLQLDPTGDLSAGQLAYLKEAALICSDELKRWAKENQAELVSIRELKEMFGK